jgi:acylphosphatase
MDASPVARRARVEGRVQGVYYRASTAAVAGRLGVRGHACNLPDGAVEVLAIGPAGAVDELIRWLWQGPPSARVTAVVIEDLDVAAHAAIRGFDTR